MGLGLLFYILLGLGKTFGLQVLGFLHCRGWSSCAWDLWLRTQGLGAGVETLYVPSKPYVGYRVP